MTTIDRIYNWIKNRKKNKFRKTLMSQIKPVWLFDRHGYHWQLTPTRTIKVIHDQIGNHIVYDDSKMVSSYYKTKEAAQLYATQYVADEIITRYFKHLLK